MNRIVRQSYPVSQLPDDLRPAISEQQSVTVTVAWGEEPSMATRPDQPKTIEELYAMAKPTFASLDEVAAHVRTLRDEWN